MNKKNTLLEASRLAKGIIMALGLVVMLAAGLLLAPASPARAQQTPGGTADANCPGPVEAYLNATGQRRAQTFTAQNSGKLVAVQLEVSESPTSSSDYVLAIHAVDASGVPTNTVLASTTVPDPTTSGDVTITGNFADPARVEAGQQYALVMKRLDSGRLDFAVRTGDDCPGKQYLSNSETGSFSESPGGDDHIFATYVTENEPPQATDDAYRVKENKTLSVGQSGILGNDSDLDGDALTARLVSGPSKGRLTLEADGSFTYKPKRNFTGKDSFVYEVDDGKGGTDQGKTTIKVVKARR